MPSLWPEATKLFTVSLRAPVSTLLTFRAVLPGLTFKSYYDGLKVKSSSSKQAKIRLKPFGFFSCAESAVGWKQLSGT